MDGNCELCKCYLPLEKHHMLHGTANRKLADDDGLTINICHSCHMELHNNNNLDLRIKKRAEVKWLSQDFDRSINKFIERYGKNYL